MGRASSCVRVAFLVLSARSVQAATLSYPATSDIHTTGDIAPIFGPNYDHQSAGIVGAAQPYSGAMQASGGEPGGQHGDAAGTVNLGPVGPAGFSGSGSIGATAHVGPGAHDINANSESVLSVGLATDQTRDIMVHAVWNKARTPSDPLGHYETRSSFACYITAGGNAQPGGIGHETLAGDVGDQTFYYTLPAGFSDFAVYTRMSGLASFGPFSVDNDPAAEVLGNYTVDVSYVPEPALTGALALCAVALVRRRNACA